MRAEAGKTRRHRRCATCCHNRRAEAHGDQAVLGDEPARRRVGAAPGPRFDVVIFDEASQIPPAQAISAISRARQVVVAGDERQLPPTNFFTTPRTRTPPSSTRG